MLLRHACFLIFSAIVVVWPGIVSAQTGSITIRELRITPRGDPFRSFAGIPQTFRPGQENNFVINPPVDFANRSADVTAVVDYSFDLQRETGNGAFFSCYFTLPEFPNEPGTNFLIRVNEGESSGSAIRFAGEGEIQLAEGIERQYNFRCRIADPANLDTLAEAPIDVTQTYEPIDTIRILSSNPPPSEPLTPGTMQTFAANVEYTRDVVRFASQVMLVATDAAGNELLPRNERGQNSSAQQASGDGPNLVRIDNMMLADVPVPGDGVVLLYAEQLSGNQFGEFEEAKYKTYNISEPVVYGGEGEVDFSVRHIEMNQAVQDDENLIPLVADRPTVARMFVTTPTPLVRGEVTVARITVTLRRDGSEEVISKPAIAAVSTADDPLFSLRNTRLLGTEIRVPLEFTRPGELEIEAVINLQDGEPIEPEVNTTNNTLTETFRFFERDTLAIGYIAASGSVETNLRSYIQKLYPLSPTRGLALIPFALTSKPDDFARAMIEATMAASSGLIDIGVAFLDARNNEDPQLLAAAVVSRMTNTPLVSGRTGRNGGRTTAAVIAARLLQSESISTREPCQSAAEGGFNAVGWDSEDSYLIHLDLYKDLLVRCIGDQNLWISPSRYARLFLRDFGPRPAALRAKGKRQGSIDLALISGEVRSDGSGSLSNVIRFPGAPAPPLVDQGEYCLEIMGASGTLRHCMTPSFGDLDTLPFAVVVPGDAASNGISLMRNGAEIASLTPSATTPAVTMTAPTAGTVVDAGPALQVSWTASDADGDTLRTTLLYSGDGGINWVPLAANLEGNTHDVDTTRIGGGEQVFLRAVVSDGLRTVQADVGPLTIHQAPAIGVSGNFDVGDGAAGVTKTVSLPIASSGTGPLRITAANFDHAAFGLASSLPLELLPDTTGGLLIAVTPPAPGRHDATLTLETNAGGSPTAVQFSVQGLDPEQPILDVISDNESIAFPETTAGSSAQAIVSLVNRGGIALSYQTAVEGEGFAMATAAALSVDGPAQAVSLGPDEQQDLVVQFVPARTGEFAGTLRITSDAPNAAERTIALAGSAVEASNLPTISTGGIVDAASFQPILTPGGIASLFGSNLAAQTAVATETPLPTSLGGVRVLVDGVAAPLFFASPTQVNFQMPFEAPLAGGVQIAVESGAEQSGLAAAPLSPYGPAVFANPATGEPIVTRADGSLVTAASPARPGDALILYVTGIGDLDNSPPSGSPSTGEPLSRALVVPQVTVGGAQAGIIFAGLTPGFVGLGQINIQLPADIPAEGGTASLVVNFDGQASSPVELPLMGL